MAGAVQTLAMIAATPIQPARPATRPGQAQRLDTARADSHQPQEPQPDWQERPEQPTRPQDAADDSSLNPNSQHGPQGRKGIDSARQAGKAHVSPKPHRGKDPTPAAAGPEDFLATLAQQLLSQNAQVQEATPVPAQAVQAAPMAQAAVPEQARANESAAGEQLQTAQVAAAFAATNAAAAAPPPTAKAEQAPAPAVQPAKAAFAGEGKQALAAPAIAAYVADDSAAQPSLAVAEMLAEQPVPLSPAQTKQAMAGQTEQASSSVATAGQAAQHAQGFQAKAFVMQPLTDVPAAQDAQPMQPAKSQAQVQTGPQGQPQAARQAQATVVQATGKQEQAQPQQQEQPQPQGQPVSQSQANPTQPATAQQDLGQVQTQAVHALKAAQPAQAGLEVKTAEPAELTPFTQSSAANTASTAPSAELPASAQAPSGRPQPSSLADQVAEGIRANNRAADQVVIRLNPPELGRLRLSFQSQDGQVQGVIRVENSQTLLQLQRELPAVLGQLSDSGIHLRRLEVMLDSTSSQQGQSAMYEGQRQQAQDQQQQLPWQGAPNQTLTGAGQAQQTYAPRRASWVGEGSLNVWL